MATILIVDDLRAVVTDGTAGGRLVRWTSSAHLASSTWRTIARAS